MCLLFRKVNLKSIDACALWNTVVFSIAHILASFINIWEAFSVHKPVTYMAFMKKNPNFFALITYVLNLLELSLFAAELHPGILIFNFFSQSVSVSILGAFWLFFKKGTEFNKCYYSIILHHHLKINDCGILKFLSLVIWSASVTCWPLLTW